MLDRVVFQDKAIVDFINKHFISLKLNIMTDDGKNFKENFNTNRTPTVVFLTPQGKEIDRISEFDGNRDKYFKTIQDYVAGQNTLFDLLKNYNKDTLDIDSNFKLVKKYIDREESSKAQKYINNVLNLDQENNYGFGEECELHQAIYKANYDEVKDAQPLIIFLKRSKNETFLFLGFLQLFQFYLSEKDTTKYLETLEDALYKMPTNTDLMYGFARTVLKWKLQNKYKRGLEYAQKAVQSRPEAAKMWDTLAWLYLVQGENQEAILAMKKAAKLHSNYKKRLKKLTSAIEENKLN